MLYFSFSIGDRLDRSLRFLNLEGSRSLLLFDSLLRTFGLLLNFKFSPLLLR